MKKIISFILTLMLIISMAIPAYAVTPSLKIPSIKIPDISNSVEIRLPQTFWDDYFEKNPIRIDFSQIKFFN
jgi:hypothetical protein